MYLLLECLPTNEDIQYSDAKKSTARFHHYDRYDPSTLVLGPVRFSVADDNVGDDR